jgi:hypothetical protein
MINEVENALTRGDCTTALIHSTRLYESEYSDNRIRMLYVSSQGCRAGINMYGVYQELTSLSSANPIGEFVRIFPSTTADSRLQSTWAGLDALQTVLIPGSVVASADRTEPNAYNSGSVLLQDLTEDAKIYGFYLSMAMIGTAGNRFGNPDTSYNQQSDFTWTTRALVQSDTTGTACSLAAGLLNFLESAAVIQSKLPSSAATAVGSALGILSVVTTAGELKCMAPLAAGGGAGSAANCANAKQRLHYRGACSESDLNAAFAAGLIEGLNAIWL